MIWGENIKVKGKKKKVWSDFPSFPILPSENPIPIKKASIHNSRNRWDCSLQPCFSLTTQHPNRNFFIWRKLYFFSLRRILSSRFDCDLSHKFNVFTLTITNDIDVTCHILKKKKSQILIGQ